jgi:MtN3 and saliva related transmembrane protein
MLAYTVSILAPIVNCIQLFPQLYKTYHTKHVEDLSLKSLCLILLTSILWLSHGYFIQDISLIAAGVITVTVNTTLITLFLKYRQKHQHKHAFMLSS